MTEQAPNANFIILAVDDDDGVIGFLKAFLEHHGYRVLTASNGKAGLQRYKDHGADLVLTDIAMPVMDGFDLIRNLKEHDPQCRVIAMTGGGQGNFTSGFLRLATVLGAVQTLAKPFEGEALLNAIHHVLAA